MQKISGSLWKFHKNDANDNKQSNCEPFKFKVLIKEDPMLLVICRMLKQLSHLNAWVTSLRLLKYLWLIVKEVCNWPGQHIVLLLNLTGARLLTVTDTKLYIPVITLSTPETPEQLKSRFNQRINWSKYVSKLKTY